MVLNSTRRFLYLREGREETRKNPGSEGWTNRLSFQAFSDYNIHISLLRYTLPLTRLANA